MKPAYAIVTGEYSDYRVLAVSTNKDTAEVWAKAVREHDDGSGYRAYTDASIEEMVLLEPGDEPKTVHRVHLREEWWDDGRTEGLRVNETDDLPIANWYGVTPSRPSVCFVRAPVHCGKGGRIEIVGRTRKAVMKVYSEQKAMWTAEPKAYKRG
jgi:hypothetical protein